MVKYLLYSITFHVLIYVIKQPAILLKDSKKYEAPLEIKVLISEKNNQLKQEESSSKNLSQMRPLNK
ncbi:MAG: hypothetical protein KDD58_01850 [Bdellovibrionales bacterium]|nr:hypothetical protein [Bdellovibrionales bacterium]